MPNDIFNPINNNLIVDISAVAEYIPKHYATLDKFISACLVILFYRGIKRTRETYRTTNHHDPFVFDDHRCDLNLRDLLCEDTDEEAMIKMYLYDKFVPGQVVLRVLDDLTDALSHHISNMALRTTLHSASYKGKVVSVQHLIINNTTLIVSCKTVDMEEVSVDGAPF